ncbi:hypothetical protein [Salidesulfovibrio onnuriiensis]|uniref:hypothetical protein n=1 Tax=Salidesulfovibrio onnuriiensis TaxID=2583823 RepID=UPI00164EF2FB|nr:hypothetical protein [Salidesulfovibrio onnuriiensis]
MPSNNAPCSNGERRKDVSDWSDGKLGNYIRTRLETDATKLCVMKKDGKVWLCETRR